MTNYVCVRKVEYLSRADAKRAAAQTGKGTRPYLCNHCSKWHLSSKSRRQVKQLRKKYSGN